MADSSEAESSAVTYWDVPEDGLAPSEALEKETIPPESHPYLRRIFNPSGMESSAGYEHHVTLNGQLRSDALREAMSIELAVSPCDKSELRLRPVPLFLELSDRSIQEANAESGATLQQEYPRLYFVLDDRNTDAALPEIEKYLRSQRTLSLALYVVENQNYEDPFELICAMVATKYLTVLFDTVRLDMHQCYTFLQSILEDGKITKVVNNLPEQFKYLGPNWPAKPKNVYDASQVEWILDEDKFETFYSLQEFQQHYRQSAACFRTLPSETFVIDEVKISSADGSLQELALEKMTTILKEVIFLQLIRNIQTQRLFRPVVNETQNHLVQVFTYEDSVASISQEDAAWDTPVTYVDAETTQVVPAPFLNTTAAETNIADQGKEDDEVEDVQDKSSSISSTDSLDEDYY